MKTLFLNKNVRENVIGCLPRRSGKSTTIYKMLGNGTNVIISKYFPLPSEIFALYHKKDYIIHKVTDKILISTNKSLYFQKQLYITSTIHVDYLFIDEFLMYNIHGLKYFIRDIISLNPNIKIVMLSTNQYFIPYERVVMEEIENMLLTKIAHYDSIKIISYPQLPKKLFKMDLN